MTFARAVISGLSVKRVLLVGFFALILLAEQWVGLDESEKFGRYIAVTSVTYFSSAFFFLLGTLCAAESVRRGAPARIAFPAALLFASVLGGIIQTVLWFDLSWRRERSIALFVVENAVEVGLWGALGMFVFYNRMRADRMLQHVRQAQMKRVQIEHNLSSSRLETARAQIDAPTLFAELASIRDSLRRDEAQASVALDSLIQRLRDSRARALELENAGQTP